MTDTTLNRTIPTLYNKKELCCGCTSCFSICPAHAITMCVDMEGFLYPSIDEAKCVRCLKCVTACSFKEDVIAKNSKSRDNYFLSNYYEEPIAYAVKHKDYDVRMNSRSGGVFTALSDVVIHMGGVIYGCAIMNNHEAIHIRASSELERNRMRGSKYIQSSLNNAFFEVENDLSKGKIVLFSGTSCQIAGLKKYLGKDNENLICVDIVCHGVPSPLVWKRYLSWQEEKKKDTIESVEFRNKKDFGWKAHIETLWFSKGDQLNSRVFTKLFYSHYILRPSCHVCPYKSIRHPGDITIADYWGIDEVLPEFNDDKGVSLVLINNEKGKKLFEKTSNIEAVQTVLENSLQPPLIAPYKPPVDREQFWINYYSKTFSWIAKKYGGYTIKNRIKSALKRLKRQQ